MTRISKLALVMALAAAIGSGDLWAQSSGKKLYKWVDEKGNVYFSDKVPPDQIKHGRKELNEQGVVTSAQGRAPTDAEREAKRLSDAEARRVANEARKKAEEDKRFLDSYATEADLKRALELSVELLAQQISSARNDIELRQKSLDRLMGRAGEIEAAGKTVDPGLLSMIESERRAIGQQTAYLATKEQEKTAAQTEYDAKLKRYQALAGARAAAPEAKKPGS